MEKEFYYVDFENSYTQTRQDIDIETEGLIFEMTAIDGYPANPHEDGTVIANVITTLSGDTFASWHHPEYRENESAMECVSDAMKRQKKNFAKYRKMTAISGKTRVSAEKPSIYKDEKPVFCMDAVPSSPAKISLPAANIITTESGDTVVDWIQNGFRMDGFVTSQIDKALARQKDEWKMASGTKTAVPHTLKEQADEYRNGWETKLLKEVSNSKSIDSTIHAIEMLMYDRNLTIHNVLEGMGYIAAKLFERDDIDDCLSSGSDDFKETRKQLNKMGVSDKEIIKKACESSHIRHLEEMHDEDYVSIQMAIEESMDKLKKEKSISSKERAEKPKKKTL